MKLGLIGYPLGHSWSCEIHSFFLKEKGYQLIPLQQEEIPSFFEKKDFDGINVTIPYKQEVMKYLDAIDPAAKKIGAVNCIVNRKGVLTGYNTDFEGFRQELVFHHVNIAGKKCAVLGSGGASKAVCEAVRSLNGFPVTVSRHPADQQISYEELIKKEVEFPIIINATPVGMKPNDDAAPVDLNQFHHLEYVIDIVANPLRTKLQFEAKVKGIPYLGGFEMLVRQAKAADEIYTKKKIPDEETYACMNVLLKERRSLVLIGMPTSGKSTIAEQITRKTGRNLIEMDQIIEEKLGTSIRECFETKGEAYFRKVESETAKSLKEADYSVISTGGGIIKNPDNMLALSENGIVVWIDRNLKYLYGSRDRPLSQSQDALAKLYEQRLPLYQKYADLHIQNDKDLESTVDEILEKTGERL